MKNNEIIQYIDKYRIENKIPIYQLTKGIMSTRNYSRLLSGETVLSFEDYSALLKRLRVPLFEFAIYLYNCRFFAYIHETNFQNAVDNKQYSEAYQIISPYLEKQTWGSVFSEKTIPMLVKYVEYKLSKISFAELITFSRDTMNLNQMLQYTILSLDDFEALFLFSGYCSSDERRLISNFVTEIIIKNEIKILSASVEHTTSRLHRLAIQLLTSFDDYDQDSLLKLKKVTQIALEYQSRAKIYGEDIYILEMLYAYYKRLNIRSNDILVEYVLAVLGSKEDNMIDRLKSLLSSDEKEYILNLILNESFKKTNLFEEGHDESIQ